jgi:hypothetical protein
MALRALDEDDLDEQVRLPPKKRACLRCRGIFLSSWAGERVCRGCKSGEAWRAAGSPFVR